MANSLKCIECFKSYDNDFLPVIPVTDLKIPLATWLLHTKYTSCHMAPPHQMRSVCFANLDFQSNKHNISHAKENRTIFNYFFIDSSENDLLNFVFFHKNMAYRCHYKNS